MSLTSMIETPDIQQPAYISLPLRNRTATANEAIALAEGRRLETQRQQTEMAIEQDVRNALQGAASAQQRLDAAVAGLCGPLRARVLQTVRAQESGLNAYKVARLLHFYALTMARTLGSRALLATTLREYVFLCP